MQLMDDEHKNGLVIGRNVMSNSMSRMINYLDIHPSVVCCARAESAWKMKSERGSNEVEEAALVNSYHAALKKLQSDDGRGHASSCESLHM